MTVSQSRALYLAATAFATLFVGFGVNAVIRPDHALTFFELKPPSAPADHRLVNSLMAVYGVRDIFMGLAIYAATFSGTARSLGWILISASAVAFADGAVCWTHGQGQWSHWSYAPIVTVVGSLLLGVFD